MKSPRTPALLLALLYAGFVALVLVSSASLPERTATHFDAAGQPNGWMTRRSHLGFMLVFGGGFPLLLVGICAATRYLPTCLVNIPHRQYWLAPERRAASQRYLVCWSLWLACTAVCFMAAIQLLVVQANRQTPPRLSTPGILAAGGGFIGALAAGIIVLFRHYHRPAKAWENDGATHPAIRGMRARERDSN